MFTHTIPFAHYLRQALKPVQSAGVIKAMATGVVLAGGLVMLAQSAMAFAPEGDLMKIKGYSPELIQVADKQRSRQEWRTPSIPKQGNKERFLHNIYYGDWTGSMDDFGSGIIRGN